MWAFVLLVILLVIYFSPELFTQEVINICRKVLKFIRASYLKEKNGYERMVKEIGPVQWWEDDLKG